MHRGAKEHVSGPKMHRCYSVSGRLVSAYYVGPLFPIELLVVDGMVL